MSRTAESLIDYTDTESRITFTVRRPDMRYLNEFMALKCAPDLLAWGVYPNVKEVTESFAAFHAVRKALGEDKLKSPAIRVICVGDGRSPRTAACFAVRSAWVAYSVDPNLVNPVGWNTKIKRLTCLRLKVEDLDWRTTTGFPDDFVTVVVAVHSHAKLAQCEKFRPALVVAVPCCVPQEYDGRPPDYSYTDWGILSPKRTVKVWDNRRRATT